MQILEGGFSGDRGYGLLPVIHKPPISTKMQDFKSLSLMPFSQEL
jgi:hypothetical protein